MHRRIKITYQKGFVSVSLRMCMFPLLKYLTGKGKAREAKKTQDVSGTAYEY